MRNSGNPLFDSTEILKFGPRKAEINDFRDAFKKKKNVTNVTLGGGGSGRQNVTFYKVVFKIHFKPFRVISEKKF